MKEFITSKKYVRMIWYLYSTLMITILVRIIRVVQDYTLFSGEFISAIIVYSFVLFAIIYLAIKLTRREANSKLIINDTYIRVNKNKYLRQSIKIDGIKSIRRIYKGVIFAKVYRIESENQILIIMINRYDNYKEAMTLIYEHVKYIKNIYVADDFIIRK